MDKTDPNPLLPRRPLFKRVRQSTRRQVDAKLTPVSIVSSVSTANTPVSTANTPPVSKDEARKTYQRELMRKRRAAAKAKDHG